MSNNGGLLRGLEPCARFMLVPRLVERARHAGIPALNKVRSEEGWPASIATGVACEAGLGPWRNLADRR